MYGSIVDGDMRDFGCDGLRHLIQQHVSCILLLRFLFLCTSYHIYFLFALASSSLGKNEEPLFPLRQGRVTCQPSINAKCHACSGAERPCEVCLTRELTG